MLSPLRAIASTAVGHPTRTTRTSRVHAPPERQHLEALFVRHLGAIERITAAFCHRGALRGEDAEDFASTVKLRLLENDYAVLRKFRGESSLPTYLTVVIATMLREYRVKEWGRWRPSAAARRCGAVAIRLEMLVCRDGLTVAQAAQVLRSSGVTDQTDAQLAALFAQLPRRDPRPRPDNGGAPPDDVAGASRTSAGVEQSELERRRRAVEEKLNQALAELPAEDQAIARLKYREGLGIADIARALRLEQKPLYRRLERMLAALRQRLEAAGVSREDIRELLGDGEVDAP